MIHNHFVQVVTKNRDTRMLTSGSLRELLAQLKNKATNLSVKTVTEWAAPDPGQSDNRELHIRKRLSDLLPFVMIGAHVPLKALREQYLNDATKSTHDRERRLDCETFNDF